MLANNNDGDDGLNAFAQQVLQFLANDGDDFDNHDGKDGFKAILQLAVRRQTTYEDQASQLSYLCSTAHEGMKCTHKDPAQSFRWRRLYTDTSLVWAMLACLDSSALRTNDAHWLGIIARLDMAIIVSGCPGLGRQDLVLQTIRVIQKACLQSELITSDLVLPIPLEGTLLPTSRSASAHATIPIFTDPPSHFAFQSNICKTPFVLKGAALNWPAISENRKWASKQYLQGIAGRGRVVPVEVGADYRTDDWTQRIESWDEFLDYLFEQPPLENPASDGLTKTNQAVRYLAQHSLFSQFPALRDDIIVPDYVYASVSPPADYPSYRPPGNEEQLVINAWIGPKGTMSPAHTDPYYNFYTQIVGRKTVWLAPPSVTSSMTTLSLSPGPPVISQSTSSSMLSNTSSFDVFTPSSLPLSFTDQISPVAMCVTLDEGDVLFFPPGWWHAMRAESTSFSVSMWF